METQCPSPKRGRPPLPKKGGGTPQIFGPCLFWPSGWMDQDATWHEGRSQPRRLSVRWGSSPLPQKGRSTPIFGPRLLWPNGCMDQDVTLNGGRPTRHCVRCGPGYPQKGHTHPTQFLAHVYCGQMAGWMETPLGTEVYLGPAHIVLVGVPAPAKGAQQPPSPLFSTHVYCGHDRPSQLLLSSCSSFEINFHD